MRRMLVKLFLGSVLLSAAPTILAQAPANENCAFTTSAHPATAIPPYVGPGTSIFSPNQNLCLPQLAPAPTGLSPLAFIVQGVEPGDRVDSQGSIYVVSIRGVPGGVDLWRWYQTSDGGPNADKTIPFKYEGQPDNCGIFSFTNGGCANNVNNPMNLGVTPGGGDADIAVNDPDPSNVNIPNVPLSSLSLAPGVTATHSIDRGDNFAAINPVAALIPGDDRQWMNAILPSTVYLTYHDVATFNIEVQLSTNGGEAYTLASEAIDPQTYPIAGSVTPTASANVAGQIKVDHNANSCPSKGNLYDIFVAPDSVTENLSGGPLRSGYVAVSTDVNLGLPVFTFTDHKIFTSPTSSPGATNGTNQVFPALAVDNFGFVYAAWSDNTNVFFSASGDQGTTWTAPIPVNSGATVGKANVFPWVAADAYGHVVVVWLGADLSGNSNDKSVMENACSDGTNRCWAQWNVYAAETVNGNASTLMPPSGPVVFTQYTASDHVIHYGTVSTGGLGGGANRNLADFFQVALDPQHRANISFADDHVISPLCHTQTPGHCNPTDPQSFRVGQPYFTYQLNANKNIVNSGSCAGSPPPPPPGAHKITGGGRIGAPINFGFIAQDTPAHAELSYHDNNANADVHSSNVTVPAVTFSGNCSTFKGSAKYNQQPGYNYNANACDNGDPNSGGAGKDTFFLTVTNALGQVVYQKGGTITSGDVELHNQ